jgi:class 3 adenylate cyclase
MAERTRILGEIRGSAHDAVVVFVDMVGSSQSKRDHENEPEVWIYKVRRFYDVVAGYVQQLGGRVIKYIGDEVMAVFDGETKDNDSANFITRIAEIQTSLGKATGEPSALKVAIDRGQIYTIDLPGHDEPDVLGTAIDRCARIGKYTKPGAVLASYEYRKGSNAAYTWALVGEPELKGVGRTKIFQLGEKTVEITETTEIAVAALERMKQESAEQ